MRVDGVMFIASQDRVWKKMHHCVDDLIESTSSISILYLKAEV